MIKSRISLIDCEKILNQKLKTRNFQILKIEEVPFEEINGYLGQHYKLKITIKSKTNQDLSFFVKYPPQVQSQLDFLTEINGIFKEENFYGKYLKFLKNYKIDILNQNLADCYLSKQGIFVFEDLTLDGYKTYPSRQPLQLKYVKSALKAFAKLHSSGLILEELRSFRLTEAFGVELKESFYLGTKSTENAMKSCKQGIKALIDCVYQDKIAKNKFKDLATSGCDLQKFFTQPSDKFRNTICHADPWTKNFLFKESEIDIDCVIVDFQTYRYSPPAQDVMAFIYLTTEKKLRDEYMDEIMEFYYGELVKCLGEFSGVVSREDFFESCLYFKQFALTQTLTYFQVVILEDGIAGELFGDEKKAQFVLFNDKYEFFKMVWEQDEVFRKRNFDAIEDLREFYGIEL